MSRIVFLGYREALYLHDRTLEKFGGESGIRDENLLRSALSAPRSGLEGVYFHADLYEMAAAYLYHIVNNHPFVDGNKRAGLAAAAVFLDLNGRRLACDEGELTRVVLAVATGAMDKTGIADFLRANCQPKDFS